MRTSYQNYYIKFYNYYHSLFKMSGHLVKQFLYALSYILTVFITCCLVTDLSKAVFSTQNEFVSKLSKPLWIYLTKLLVHSADFTWVISKYRAELSRIDSGLTLQDMHGRMQMLYRVNRAYIRLWFTYSFESWTRSPVHVTECWKV